LITSSAQNKNLQIFTFCNKKSLKWEIIALEILTPLFRLMRTKKYFSFIKSFAEKIEMRIIKL
jgi:hypothetical protein